jgi:hypothetical protein
MRKIFLTGLTRFTRLKRTEFRNEVHEGHEKAEMNLSMNAFLKNDVNLVNPVQKLPFIGLHVPHV